MTSPTRLASGFATFKAFLTDIADRGGRPVVTRATIVGGYG
jgi:hypothetical protein